MEESRWNGVAEAYRAVQNFLRDGRWQEALKQAERIFAEGGLGRKYTARLHSQVCWLYAEQLPRIAPAAILHGEEAVRLSEMIQDEWVRTEARSRLVHAYCRLGDLDRARAACRDIARDLEKNSGAMAGGTAALMQLEATIALAAGEEEGCLCALGLAEELVRDQAPAIQSRLYLQKALALLEFGRAEEAADILHDMALPDDGPPEARLEWSLAHTWLAVLTQPVPAAAKQLDELLGRASASEHVGTIVQCLGLRAVLAERAETSEAPRLARLAIDRCLATGRHDLLASLRRRLGRLLA